MFIEMSRDVTHGGGSWEFPNCIWAPTEKRKTGGKWPFWAKILQVQDGATVLHLRGAQPKAHFIGYSRVNGTGYETAQRPPNPGQWGHSKAFYRADLSNFTPFASPISLTQVFRDRRDKLLAYFLKNRARPEGQRLRLFFVHQSNRIQCLNGAYLSDLDAELWETIFDDASPVLDVSVRTPELRVTTGWQLAQVKARIGQERFAQAVKSQYGCRCCFPGCGIGDPRFLIGAHIARWSDNEALRGDTRNGLCLCLTHDRAFELGLFQLDDDYRVIVPDRLADPSSSVVSELTAHRGEQIRVPAHPPHIEALREHRARTGRTHGRDLQS